MTEIKFILNGKETITNVEDGELLVEMLRNRLGFTGTKIGCEVGECGACTVLVDGVPTDSCLYLAALADGHEIMTIEGVEQNRELSDIQQAFLDAGAVQCGFCTPGLIMTSYALLSQNIHLTKEDIKRGLAGNMCRCATYGQVIEAVQAAREKRDAEAKGEKYEPKEKVFRVVPKEEVSL